jgi:tape measure domain-containing protein
MASRRELIVALTLLKTNFDEQLKQLKVELSTLEKGVYIPLSINPASLRKINEQIASLRRKFAGLEASASIQAQLETSDFLRKAAGLKGIIRNLSKETIGAEVATDGLDKFIDQLIEISASIAKLPESVQMEFALNDKQAFAQINKLQAELIRINNIRPLVSLNITPAYRQITFLLKELSYLEEELTLTANAAPVLAEINRIRDAVASIRAIRLRRDEQEDGLNSLLSDLSRALNLLQQTYSLQLDTSELTNLENLLESIDHYLNSPKELRLETGRASEAIAQIHSLIDSLPLVKLDIDPDSNIEQKIKTLKETLSECVDLCVHTDKAEKVIRDLTAKLKEIETYNINLAVDTQALQATVESALNTLNTLPKTKTVTVTVKAGKDSLTEDQLANLTENTTVLAAKISDLRNDIEPLLSSFKELTNLKLDPHFISFDKETGDAYKDLISELKNLPSVVDVVATRVDNLNTKLNTTAQGVANLKQDLSDLNNLAPTDVRVDLNRTAYDAQTDALVNTPLQKSVTLDLDKDTADKKLAEWLDATAKQKKVKLNLSGVQKLQAALDKIGECIDVCIHTDKAEEAIASLSQKLEDLNSKEINLLLDLQNIQEGVAQTLQLLNNLPQKRSVTLTVARGKNSLNTEQLNALATNFETIANNLKALKTEAAETVDNLQALNALELKNLELNFDKKNWDEILNFITSIKALPAYLDASINKLNSMGGRINSLTDAISQFKNKVTENLATTNTAQVDIDAKLEREKFDSEIASLCSENKTLPVTLEINIAQADADLNAWVNASAQKKQVVIELTNLDTINAEIQKVEKLVDGLIVKIKELAECADVCVHTDKAEAAIDALLAKWQDIKRLDISVNLDIEEFKRNIDSALQLLNSFITSLKALPAYLDTAVAKLNSMGDKVRTLTDAISQFKNKIEENLTTSSNARLDIDAQLEREKFDTEVASLLSFDKKLTITPEIDTVQADENLNAWINDAFQKKQIGIELGNFETVKAEVASIENAIDILHTKIKQIAECVDICIHTDKAEAALAALNSKWQDIKNIDATLHLNSQKFQESIETVSQLLNNLPQTKSVTLTVTQGENNLTAEQINELANTFERITSSLSTLKTEAASALDNLQALNNLELKNIAIDFNQKNSDELRDFIANLDALPSYLDTAISKVDGLADTVKALTDTIGQFKASIKEDPELKADINASLDRDKFDTDVSALLATDKTLPVKASLDVTDAEASINTWLESGIQTKNIKVTLEGIETAQTATEKLLATIQALKECVDLCVHTEKAEETITALITRWQALTNNDTTLQLNTQEFQESIEKALQLLDSLPATKPITLLLSAGENNLTTEQINDLFYTFNRLTQTLIDLKTEAASAFDNLQALNNLEIKNIEINKDGLVGFLSCIETLPSYIDTSVSRLNGLADRLKSLSDTLAEFKQRIADGTDNKTSLKVEATLDRQKLDADIAALLTDKNTLPLTATVDTSDAKAAVDTFVAEDTTTKSLKVNLEGVEAAQAAAEKLLDLFRDLTECIDLCVHTDKAEEAIAQIKEKIQSTTVDIGLETAELQSGIDNALSLLDRLPKTKSVTLTVALGKRAIPAEDLASLSTTMGVLAQHLSQIKTDGNDVLTTLRDISRIQIDTGANSFQNLIDLADILQDTTYEITRTLDATENLKNSLDSALSSINQFKQTAGQALTDRDNPSSIYISLDRTAYDTQLTALKAEEDIKQIQIRADFSSVAEEIQTWLDKKIECKELCVTLKDNTEATLKSRLDELVLTKDITLSFSFEEAEIASIKQSIQTYFDNNKLNLHFNLTDEIFAQLKKQVEESLSNIAITFNADGLDTISVPIIFDYENSLNQLKASLNEINTTRIKLEILDHAEVNADLNSLAEDREIKLNLAIDKAQIDDFIDNAELTKTLKINPDIEAREETQKAEETVNLPANLQAVFSAFETSFTSELNQNQNNFIQRLDNVFDQSLSRLSSILDRLAYRSDATARVFQSERVAEDIAPQETPPPVMLNDLDIERLESDLKAASKYFKSFVEKNRGKEDTVARYTETLQNGINKLVVQNDTRSRELLGRFQDLMGQYRPDSLHSLDEAPSERLTLPSQMVDAFKTDLQTKDSRTFTEKATSLINKMASMVHLAKGIAPTKVDVQPYMPNARATGGVWGQKNVHLPATTLKDLVKGQITRKDLAVIIHELVHTAQNISEKRGDNLTYLTDPQTDAERKAATIPEAAGYEGTILKKEKDAYLFAERFVDTFQKALGLTYIQRSEDEDRLKRLTDAKDSLQQLTTPGSLFDQKYQSKNRISPETIEEYISYAKEKINYLESQLQPTPLDTTPQKRDNSFETTVISRLNIIINLLKSRQNSEITTLDALDDDEVDAKNKKEIRQNDLNLQQQTQSLNERIKSLDRQIEKSRHQRELDFPWESNSNPVPQETPRPRSLSETDRMARSIQENLIEYCTKLNDEIERADKRLIKLRQRIAEVNAQEEITKVTQSLLSEKFLAVSDLPPDVYRAVRQLVASNTRTTPGSLSLDEIRNAIPTREDMGLKRQVPVPFRDLNADETANARRERREQQSTTAKNLLETTLRNKGIEAAQLDPLLYRSLKDLVERAIAKGRTTPQIEDLLREIASQEDLADTLRTEADSLRQNDDANTNRIVNDNDIATRPASQTGGDGNLPPSGGGRGSGGGDDDDNIPFDPNDDGEPRDEEERRRYRQRVAELRALGERGQDRRARLNDVIREEERNRNNGQGQRRSRRFDPLTDALLDISIDSIEAYNNALGNGLRIAVRIRDILGDPDIANALKTNIGSIASLVGFLGSAFGLGALVLIGQKTNIEFQKLDKTLRALNIRQASLIKQKIPTLALTSGVDVGDLAQGIRKFSASTDNTNLAYESPRIFESVIKYATVVGSTNDEISRGLVALDQIASKGRVSLEEINGQLAEALSGSTNIAASSLNLTKAEFYKMIQAGDLLAEDLLPAMATRLEDIADNSKNLDLTLPQEWSKLMQGFKLVSASSTEGFMEGLRDTFAGINDLFMTNQEVIQVSINRMRDLLLVILSLSSVAGAVAGVKLLTRAFVGLSAVLGLPGLAVGALIIGLTTALSIFNSLKSEIDVLGKYGKQSKADWESFNEQLKQNSKTIEALNAKRFTSIKTTPLYQEIIVDVKGKNPTSRFFLATQVQRKYGKQLRQDKSTGYFEDLKNYGKAYNIRFNEEALGEKMVDVAATDFVNRNKTTITNTKKLIAEANTSIGKGDPLLAASYQKDLEAINRVIKAERERVELLSALSYISQKAQQDGVDLQQLLQKPLFAEALEEDIKYATTYEQLLNSIAQKTAEATKRSNLEKDKIFPGGDQVFEGMITHLEELIVSARDFGGENEKVNKQVLELEATLQAVKQAQKDYNDLVEDSVTLNTELASALKTVDNNKALGEARIELADAIAQQNLLKELVSAGVTDTEVITKTKEDLQRKKIEEQIISLRRNYVSTEQLSSALSSKTKNIIELEFGDVAQDLDVPQLNSLIENQALPQSDIDLLTRLKEQQFNLASIVQLENELLELDIQRNAELKERNEEVADAAKERQDAKDAYDKDVEDAFKQLQDAGDRLREAYEDFAKNIQRELEDINRDIQEQLRTNTQNKNKLESDKERLLYGSFDDDLSALMADFKAKLEDINNQRFDLETEEVSIQREFEDGLGQLQDIFQDYLDSFADIAAKLADAKQDYVDKLADIDADLSDSQAEKDKAASLGADTSSYDKNFDTLVNDVEQDRDTSRADKLPRTFTAQAIKEKTEAVPTVTPTTTPSTELYLPPEIPSLPELTIDNQGDLLDVVVEIRDILKGRNALLPSDSQSTATLEKIDTLASNTTNKGEAEYYKFLSRIVRLQQDSGGKEGMWLDPATFESIKNPTSSTTPVTNASLQDRSQQIIAENNSLPLSNLVGERRNQKLKLNQLKQADLNTAASQEIVDTAIKGNDLIKNDLTSRYQELNKKYTQSTSRKDIFTTDKTQETRKRIEEIEAEKQEIDSRIEAFDRELKTINTTLQDPLLSSKDRVILSELANSILNQKANYSQLDPDARLKIEEQLLQRQGADATRLFDYNLFASQTIDPQIRQQENILSDVDISQDTKDRANYEIERLNQIKTYEADVQGEVERLENLGYAFIEARQIAEDNIRSINNLKLDRLKDEFNSVGKFAKTTFEETTTELFNLQLFNAEESIGNQLIGMLKNVLDKIRDWSAAKFTDWLNEKLFADLSDKQTPLLAEASVIIPSLAPKLTELGSYPSVQDLQNTSHELSNAFTQAHQNIATNAVSAETQAIETILSNRGQLTSKLDGTQFTAGINPKASSNSLGNLANSKSLAYLAGGSMILQGALEKENRGRNIGAGIGTIAGTAFGGSTGGMLGGALGGLIGSLFNAGGTVDPQKKPENLLSAIAEERRKSGKKPVLAVLHENEEVLSTLNGDAQAFRAIQDAGIWASIKNHTMYAGGTVGSSHSKVLNQSSLSFAHNSDRSNRSITNINNTINLQANSRDAVAYSLEQLSERKGRMPN